MRLACRISSPIPPRNCMDTFLFADARRARLASVYLDVLFGRELGKDLHGLEHAWMLQRALLDALVALVEGGCLTLRERDTAHLGSQLDDDLGVARQHILRGALEGVGARRRLRLAA